MMWGLLSCCFPSFFINFFVARRHNSWSLLVVHSSSFASWEGRSGPPRPGFVPLVSCWENLAPVSDSRSELPRESCVDMKVCTLKCEWFQLVLSTLTRKSHRWFFLSTNPRLFGAFLKRDASVDFFLFMINFMTASVSSKTNNLTLVSDSDFFFVHFFTNRAANSDHQLCACRFWWWCHAVSCLAPAFRHEEGFSLFARSFLALSAMAKWGRLRHTYATWKVC